LRTLTIASLVFAAAAPAAFGQGNVVPGRDAQLFSLNGMSMLGRIGTYPDGFNGLSMSTTVCNVGAGSIPWQAPMNEDHPMIAFIVVRESGGRLEQISDYSFVKHGFFSTNSGGCGSCPGGSPSQLSVGCSDTYSTNNNANRYYLGPPGEIDPWLGTWASVCSHFDRGEPAVAPPNDCDGVRSLTMSQANAMGPVRHRVLVPDAALGVAGASYAYYSGYVIKGEAEIDRWNNIGWRGFNPSWSVAQNRWNFSSTTGLAYGSVLDSWSGATVGSSDNGGFDGRVYVASKVSAGGSCAYHYEYAFHNRDNAGGVDAIRIPLAPGTLVSNVGFKDVDQDALNDWTAAVVAGELVLTGAGNPLPWNAIYNVWFDASAAPASGSLTLEQASLLPDFAVSGIDTPTGAPLASSLAFCTSGTSASGCVAVLSSTGVPSASASSGFVATATSVEGSKDGQFFYGTSGRQAVSWGNGTSYRCVVPPTLRGGLLTGVGSNGQCDGSFSQDLTALWTAKPSKNPGAGSTAQLQLWYRDPQSTSNVTTSFSGGLEFTLCP
jgi:hypothetical protein